MAPKGPARRLQLISVFGPFNSRALVEMPVEAAEELFDGPLLDAGRRDVIEAVERDVGVVRRFSPELADSALAASALALAYEMQNPFNSATSKSMCAREMRDTLDRLRELMPDRREADGLDELSDRRSKRLADQG